MMTALFQSNNNLKNEFVLQVQYITKVLVIMRLVYVLRIIHYTENYKNLLSLSRL